MKDKEKREYLSLITKTRSFILRCQSIQGNEYRQTRIYAQGIADER